VRNYWICTVEGNAPEKIEEIFGPGQYNILKEMSAERKQTLQKIYRGVKSRLSAEEQAKAGVRRLQDVLQTNVLAGLPPKTRSEVISKLPEKFKRAGALLPLTESNEE